MNNVIFLQRVKTLILSEIKTEALFAPLLLISLSAILNLFTIQFEGGADRGNLFAFTFLLLVTVVDVFVILIGWALIASILVSREKRLSSISSGLLGFLVGLVLVLILNYFLLPFIYAVYTAHPTASHLSFLESISSLENFLYHIFFVPLVISNIIIVITLAYMGWKAEYQPSLQIRANYQEDSSRHITYFRQYKILVFQAVKISILPWLLPTFGYAVLDPALVIMLKSDPLVNILAAFDYVVLPALIVYFLGVVLISLFYVLWKKAISNISAIFLGLMIGMALTLIANYIHWINYISNYGHPIFSFFDYTFPKNLYEFIELVVVANLFYFPGIIDILILTYVGQKLNRAKILETALSTKE